ncbi:MAG: ChaN family lipoprotein, partial [Candidatus Aminicenantes bacterium]|nr:ChaN family lipoprotein [Candidatus Aminicenantes bacterium]
MAKAKVLISLTLIISLCSWAAESQNDTLPLGSSKFKYELAKIERDQIYETRSQKVIDISDLVEAFKNTDVFVIGEFHDNYDCHVFQRNFIEALYQRYPKIVVGFEFFKREDNRFLEQWRNGEINDGELIEKTGWYKKTALNYGYTKVVMDIIKKYRIQTIGLNVSRKILRKVSRKGFNSLSVEEKKLFPTIHIPNAEHRYLIETIFGNFATQVPFWFDNIYNAQRCWDVVMAESMREMLEKNEFRGYKGIIIAGNFHVAYGLGIPFRYKKAQKSVRITTIIPVSLTSEDTNSEDDPHPMKKMFANQLTQVAVFSRGIGDYVFSASESRFSHFPDLGIKCKKVGEKFQISQVKKKSIGEEFGLKKGDFIDSVDGISIKTIEQFRLLSANKKWGDSIKIRVEKKIDFKK